MKIKDTVGAPFTSKSDVNAYFAGDKIQCLICGKWFHSLGTHLVRVHQVSIEEYKEHFNLPWGRGLVADETRAKCAAALKRRVAEGDPALVVTDEERERRIRKAIATKQRPPRSYDLKRIIEQGKVATAAKVEATRARAIEILEKMERDRLPACYYCCQPGQEGVHALYNAMRKDKDLKLRYEAARANIPDLIELKTGLTNAEIAGTVFKLRADGMTTKDIAKEMRIGKTTVKRILRGEGKWLK